MQKQENHQTQSNIMLYHTRLISIDISALVITPNYINACVNLTKIGLVSFLEI